MKEIVLIFLILSLFLFPFHHSLNMVGQLAASGIIVVPDDCSSIHQAVEKASAGDCIIVRQGVYEENLIINKPLTITGMGAMIKRGPHGDAVKIIVKNVNFSGFYIVGSGGFQYSGINVRCSGAYLKDNIVSGFLYGIQLYDSKSITLRNNVMFDNRFNLKVWGLTLDHFLHDINCSNIVNGRKVCYIVGLSHFIVPPDAGYVGVINSSCVTIENVCLSSNAEGILMAYSRYCEIKNAEISNSERGVRLIASNNVTLSNSSIQKSEWAGVVIDSSVDNQMFNNTVKDNGVGVVVSSSILLGLTSKKNVVKENQIMNNGYGIYLSEVYDNTISRNKIRLNNIGIFIDSSEGNIVQGNIVEGNSVGVQIHLSSGNFFYHNSFNGNLVHVGINDLTSTNAWNMSYPIGGNFWGNTTGVDVFCGSEQNILGSDGVMDEQYKIAEGNIDSYPFKFPILSFDAGFWVGKAYFVDIVTNATVSDFGFDLWGKYVSFNAYSADADSCFFGVLVSKNLLWCDSVENWRLLVDDVEHPCRVLENSNYTYVCFEFDSCIHSFMILGDHSIEENLVFGDVNNDGKVDLIDLSLVACAYGSFPGHPRWNVWADLDKNGEIDVHDVYLIIMEIALRH
jgi:parallel beta-helix repeat protein